MKTKEYKISEYLSVDKNGKLKLKQSKEKLIKLAENEILKWKQFIKNLEDEI